MLWTCLLSILVTRTGYGQHTDGDAIRFTLFKETHSWNEVYNICHSLGETMLHLHSKSDIDIFHSFTDVWKTAGLLTGDVWTGLLDNDTKGVDFQFVFENCHTFDDDDTLWSAINTAEPNEKGIEKCVRFQPRDGLRTRRCDYHHFTVCQKDLGSCWFEDFRLKDLDLPNAIKDFDIASSLDECKQLCQTRNTQGNLCVALVFVDTKCTLYMGTAVYINDAPSMTDSLHTVAVKRCFEGTYEATTPIVTANNSQDPATKCIFPSSLSNSLGTSVLPPSAVLTHNATENLLANNIVTSSMLLTENTYVDTITNTLIESTATSLPAIEKTLAQIHTTNSISPFNPTSDPSTLSESFTIGVLAPFKPTEEVFTLADMPATNAINPLKPSAEVSSLTELPTTDPSKPSVEATTLAESSTTETIASLKPTWAEMPSTDTIYFLKPTAEVETLSQKTTTNAVTPLKPTSELSVLAEMPTSDAISPSTANIASTMESKSNPMTPPTCTTDISSDASSTPTFDIVNNTETPSTTGELCEFGARHCICKEYSPEDLAALEELISSLIMDKRDLSSYRRKKTSAPDPRVSATSLGNLGIAFLALVFISIVILDCGRVFRCFSSMNGNIKKQLNA